MKFKLVCGPPGAGKNHFVEKNFRSGDIILDFDRIYDAVTMQGIHTVRHAWMQPVISSMKNAAIDNLRTLKQDNIVWVIACLPEGRRREATSRRLQSADTFLIMPEKSICLKHIQNDNSRQADGYYTYVENILADWYKKYTPSSKDIVIKE